MPLDSLPEPGGALTLDLGSGSVGWAYGLLTRKLPIFGTWRLPAWGGDGAIFAALENMLAETMDLCQPTAVVIEKSLSLQALAEVSNLHTVEKQIGLRAMAYSEAYRHSAACSQIDTKSVRYEVTGRCHFAKKGEAKAWCMGYCRRQGMMVETDHEADACLIWLWYRARIAGIPAGGLWAPAGTA